MKFLEAVNSLSSSSNQNFSNWHFCFLTHSVAVAAWSGVERVGSQDPFRTFLSPGAQEPGQPPNNIC